ncbi:uncharacterized protein LOC130943874 isoform X2 [Arachis stenosperma]|nr:uncharacterized protein LOC130943874 isoform X2 [Arachis stenosperma]
MLKDWINLSRYCEEYINGVISFLDFAYSEEEPDRQQIECPCKRCCNIEWYKRDVVFDHLVADGFVKGYRTWINHGEWTIPMVVDDNRDDEKGARNDIEGLLNDTFGDVPHAEGVTVGQNEKAKKFYNLIDGASQELYPGCKKFFTLNQETQNAIEDFQNLQAACETEEEVFEALFRKEQLGRVRWYGRSVTKSDLKKYAEISEIKNQHKEEVTTLKDKLGDMEAKLQKQEENIHGLWNMVKLILQRSKPGMRSKELEALLQDAQHSPIDTNSAHGATHFPKHRCATCEAADPATTTKPRLLVITTSIRHLSGITTLPNCFNDFLIEIEVESFFFQNRIFDR